MKDPAQPTNGQHPPARATVVVEVGGLCWATEKALVEQVLAGRPGITAVEANPRTHPRTRPSVWHSVHRKRKFLRRPDCEVGTDVGLPRHRGRLRPEQRSGFAGSGAPERKRFGAGH